MSKTSKPSDYTHSPWSSEAYKKPQTLQSLTAEGKAVINAHPSLNKWRAGSKASNAWLDQYISAHKV